MSDLISRQAAIEALDKEFWKSLNIPICKEIRNVAKETIKALPSAQPDVPDINFGDMVSRQAAIDADTRAVER